MWEDASVFGLGMLLYSIKCSYKITAPAHKTIQMLVVDETPHTNSRFCKQLLKIIRKHVSGLHNITSQQVWESTWIITEIPLSSKLVFIALNPWALWVNKPVHVSICSSGSAAVQHVFGFTFQHGEDHDTNKPFCIRGVKWWLIKESLCRADRIEHWKYSKGLKTRAELSELRLFTVSFLF